MTARVRRKSMIPGGNRLAKRVINSCMDCRARKCVLNKQKLSGAVPIVYIDLDMFGPISVKDLAQ